MSDWNTNVINEFRANGGRVGGDFEGAPLILLHHTGRRSGADYVAPLMYQADASDPETIYLFASKAGAPTDPEWYRNISAVGHATLETGEGSYEADVSEVVGDERERIFGEQVKRFPGFGEYAEKTAGIREIPVVALRRRG